MKVAEIISNEAEIRAALNLRFNPPKRNKFDLSRRQLRSFYREFKQSLLVINETPLSWIVVTKNYGTFNVSKEYSIRCGLFIKYIDTWYLTTFLKGTAYQISYNPVR